MIKRIIEILAVGTTHFLLQFVLIFIATDGFIMLAILGSDFWKLALPYILLDYFFVAFLLPTLLRRTFKDTAKKLLLLQLLLVPPLSGIIGVALIFICSSVIERDMYLPHENRFIAALIISIMILAGEVLTILPQKLFLLFSNWVKSIKLESE